MDYSLSDYPISFYVTYIIKLEHDCWYVGRTKNGSLNKRLTQHLTQCGTSGWCYTHKPIQVYRILKGDREKEITKKLIAKYGEDKVRGSSFVKVIEPSWDNPLPVENIHGCISITSPIDYKWEPLLHT